MDGILQWGIPYLVSTGYLAGGTWGLGFLLLSAYPLILFPFFLSLLTPISSRVEDLIFQLGRRVT